MPDGAGLPPTFPSQRSVRVSCTAGRSATLRGAPPSVRQISARLTRRRETEPTSMSMFPGTGPTIAPGLISFTRGRGAWVSTSVVRGTVTDRPSWRSVTRTR
jgi:hypothetical protein